MSEPFVAEIRIFAGNFAPRSWAFCDGQLLAVSQNDALFSLFGTIYGGDGRTTFGLPDLRGRIPLHAGDGPGLSPRRLGSRGGAEKVAEAGAGDGGADCRDSEWVGNGVGGGGGHCPVPLIRCAAPELRMPGISAWHRVLRI